MFSVIIPTYNRAHSIGATLDSVKAQSYRPIEIILVDDGSSDETEAVVTHWSSEVCNQESKITLRYCKQVNAGAPAARNRGLREFNGDYLQFLDSDDRLHPQRFQRLAEAFEQQKADFIQTSIEWFDPATNQAVNTLWARPDESQVHLVLNGQFWANTLRGALRRELAERIGPWTEQMTCFEDREYMERAVMQAKKPIALKPILGYLARGEGAHVSNQHTTYEGRRWRIFSERKLVEQVLLRNDLDEAIRSTLASRIYRVGCRSAEKGWYAYAQECAEIGDCLNVHLSLFARIKRAFCRMDALGAHCYKIIGFLKTISR